MDADVRLVEELTPEGEALLLDLAEKQAAKDRELLAQLQSRPQQEPIEVVTDHEVDDDGVPMSEPRRPLNRAQRRQLVRNYADLLKLTSPPQVPVRNPTIIPKSKRRRRKGGRNAT